MALQTDAHVAPKHLVKMCILVFECGQDPAFTEWLGGPCTAGPGCEQQKL